MDWWFIPVGIGLALLGWFVWVAAFHKGETVTAVSELDAYVLRGRSGVKPASTPPGERSDGPSPTVVRDIASGESGRSDPGVDVEEEDPEARHGSTHESEAIADGEGGIWIELDIRPLFPSSQSQQLVDLAEIEDPEVVP